jgi:hypothetical protein
LAIVLVKLRFAIQRGARRRDGVGARARYALGWILGSTLGALAGLGTAGLLGWREPVGGVLALLATTVLFVAWLLAPIMMPAFAGGVIDPGRLEQYSLGPREQVLGLLLGGLLTPAALFTFLFAAGAAAASGLDLAARLAALGGAVLFTILCVASSYAMSAVLAGTLTTRRGREAGALLSGLLVLAISLASLAIRDVAVIVDAANGPVGAVLSWTGSTTWIALAARDGLWLDVAARVVVALAVIVLALVAWAWGIRRHRRGASTGAPARGPARRSGAGTSVVPIGFRDLPSGPRTAAFAQQLRYYFFRSPRAVQSLVLTPIVGVFLAHAQLELLGLAFATALFATIAVIGPTLNVFAYDAHGVEFDETTGASWRDILTGKLLACLTFLVPLVLLMAIVESWLNDLWSELGVALVAGFAAMASTVAVGAVASVHNAFDQSQKPDRPGRTLVGVFASVIVAYGLVIIGAGIWSGLARAITLPLAAGIVLLAAIALAAGGISSAGRRLDRGPALLTARFTAR